MIHPKDDILLILDEYKQNHLSIDESCIQLEKLFYEQTLAVIGQDETSPVPSMPVLGEHTVRNELRAQQRASSLSLYKNNND